MNMGDQPSWRSSSNSFLPQTTPPYANERDEGYPDDHERGGGERRMTRTGTAASLLPRPPSLTRVGTMTHAPSMTRSPSMTRVSSMTRVGSQSKLTRGISMSQLGALRRRGTTASLTVVLQIANQELTNLDGFATTGMHRAVVASFSSLCAIYVQRNKIDSLDAIAACAKSLRILNVASNELETLPSMAFWITFTKLSVLDVSHNHLAKWKHVQGVVACRSLVLFRIQGNPVAAQPSCRAVIVNQMPFLIAVDEHVITDEEKIERASYGPRFCAKHDKMVVSMWHPWRHGPARISSNEELAPALKAAFSAMKRLVERNSPVTIVQRMWRGHVSRTTKVPSFQVIRRAVQTIQRVYRGSWLRRHLWSQLHQVLVPLHKEMLLLPTWQLQRYRAAPRIMAVWIARREHVRAKKAMNFVKAWLRSTVAASAQLQQAMVSSSDQLRIYCDAASVGSVLDAAARCMALDARLTGIDAAHLTSRVLPTGISIVRPSTYNFCHVHRQSWLQRAITLTRCDGVFRVQRASIQPQLQLLQAECKLVREDLRRLSGATAQTTAESLLDRRHRQCKLVETQERHVWLATNLKLQQQKLKHMQSHRRTPCLFDRALPINPRGNSHLVERPKPLPPWKPYDQVFLFVPTSVAMHRRILYLLKHSHRYHSLSVYTARDMAQICAATTVQSAYRSYRTRTRCQFVKLFLQRRAILCLQRWWRNMSTLAWRLEMYEACVRVVAAIDSSVVYIEERVFMTLKHPSLTQRALSMMPRLPSHEWKFKFSNRQLRMPITLEESLSRLPEDEKQAYLNTFYVENGLERVGFPVWIPSTPHHEIVGREEKQVSKHQVGLIVTSYCTESVVTDAVDPPTPLDDIERCSDMDFGNFTACRNIVQDNVTLLKAHEANEMNWSKAFGITLVKLEFDSVAEARHRAAMLLVKTYDARHKTYARLYTVGMLRYLWLNKPAMSRQGHLYSRDWMRLRLDLPSKWGSHHDTYSHSGGSSGGDAGSAHHMLLLRGHRPSTVPGTNEEFSASEITAPLSHRSQLLSSHMETEEDEKCFDQGGLGSPTAAMLVQHVKVQVDYDPSYELHMLKQQQAETVRLESEALETKLHHAKSVALKAKQLHVSTTQFTPRPPESVVKSSSHVAKCRKAKFEDRLQAVESAIKADEAGEARAAAILHRMRLAERAHQAVHVERKMVARENAAKIAAHKIKIDAQLQRSAYEQAQLLLVKQQRKAVEAALATRKKAQRQFAKNFGQKAVGLMRCHARDRAQDRAVAAFEAPMERVQFAKVAERKVDESIRVKRTDLLVANQRTRVVQSMEIQAALEFQDTQERQRLDDIQARISQERKLKQLLQTEDF